MISGCSAAADAYPVPGFPPRAPSGNTSTPGTREPPSTRVPGGYPGNTPGIAEGTRPDVRLFVSWYKNELFVRGFLPLTFSRKCLVQPDWKLVPQRVPNS
eukprot:1259755-Rhodomonas_salina.1